MLLLCCCAAVAAAAVYVQLVSSFRRSLRSLARCLCGVAEEVRGISKGGPPSLLNMLQQQTGSKETELLCLSPFCLSLLSALTKTAAFSDS